MCAAKFQRLLLGYVISDIGFYAQLMLYQQTAQTLLFTRSFHLAILTDLYTLQMALPVKVTLFSHD